MKSTFNLNYDPFRRSTLNAILAYLIHRDTCMFSTSQPHRTSEWMVMAPDKRIKKAVLLAVVVVTCSSCRS